MCHGLLLLPPLKKQTRGQTGKGRLIRELIIAAAINAGARKEVRKTTRQQRDVVRWGLTITRDQTRAKKPA
jgi:hypothetical protein